MPQSKSRMHTLYFIGTHLLRNKKTKPVFTVKNTTYPPKDEFGQVAALGVGDPLQVPEADVQALLNKGRTYIRPKGWVESFTLDPNIAASVKARWEQGQESYVSKSMSMEDALALMTPEEMNERVLSNLSLSELEAAVEARRREQVKQAVDNPAFNEEGTSITEETPPMPSSRSKRKTSESKEEE